MELFILANASLQALFTRRPGEALMIANSALESGELTNRERVIFATRQARALAQLGDRDAALRRMDEAQATFWDGASSRDPAWAWWVDAAEVRAHIALAHGDLGDAARAAELLQRSVEDCPPRRLGARFIYLAQQLRALLEVGAWTDAEMVIEQAIPYIGEVNSGRTLGLLRQALTQLENGSTPPRLVEVGHNLRTTLSAADFPISGSRPHTL
jgi:tetratricopeptide (TPR) repeat protein